MGGDVYAGGGHLRVQELSPQAPYPFSSSKPGSWGGDT